MDFQVIAASPRWSLNGVNAFTADLIRGLVLRGVRAQILLTDPSPSHKPAMSRPDGIPFETLPVSVRDSMQERRRLFMNYLEERAPCVYLPNYDYAYSCVSPCLSRRIVIAGIIHSDDPEHYEHARRLGASWDGLVSVSETIGRRILRAHPATASRMRVIPYGVPASRGDDGPQRWGGPLKVIYAGRMNRYQKRVHDLARIALRLHEQHIPCEWTLAGDGPDCQELKREFSKVQTAGVPVQFTGVLPRPALADLFRQQDIFLMTSDFEGLPLALLEAMGQGCVPVVSRTESGIPEILCDGENGFTVPAGNISAFAARMAVLYRQPALGQRLSAKARETILARYSVNRMTDDYLHFFQELLKVPETARPRQIPGKILRPPLLPADPARLASFLKTGGLYARQWMGRKLQRPETAGLR